MKKQFTIICRNSRLSLIQGQSAKRLMERIDPSVSVDIRSKPSRGDLDLTTPLYLMGDKNIFTKDIEDVLTAGEADFAVHSLKDLSTEKLDDPRFRHAIFERDLMHDVVVFSPDFLEKRGQEAPEKRLRLGTSSLRRAELVPPFLKKYVLPSYGMGDFQVEMATIRGNVDTRLRKLLAGDYDAIVLAAAGLNRLCRHEADVKDLLSSCTVVLLPLIECPPAAGQGALVAECLAENEAAAAILERLHDAQLGATLDRERHIARQLGAGCHQRFGVVSFATRGGVVTRVAGRKGDAEGEAELDMMGCDVPLSDFDFRSKKLFSATDFMRDFFGYAWQTPDEQALAALDAAEIVFVAHHRAAMEPSVLARLKHKKVWASGTRSWRELAQLGVPTLGCADGFGFHFLDKAFESALFGVEKAQIVILTNTHSAAHWRAEGYAAVGTYTLKPQLKAPLTEIFGEASLFFWTNFEQYQLAKPFIQKNVQHACPSGKTAELFVNEGITPVIFPNIKAFLAWREQHTQHV